MYVEGQNNFRLRGQTATLAGKPDLIVVHGDDVLIVDVKTGRQQPWHAVPVMIYMYALPRALPQYRDVRLADEVVNQDHTVRVPRGGLHTQRWTPPSARLDAEHFRSSQSVVFTPAPSCCATEPRPTKMSSTGVAKLVQFTPKADLPKLVGASLRLFLGCRRGIHAAHA